VLSIASSLHSVVRIGIIDHDQGLEYATTGIHGHDGTLLTLTYYRREVEE
jgi:hypothetical protein